MDRNHFTQFYAEALREAGVLVSVFGPMYSLFEGDAAGWAFLCRVGLWLAMGVVIFHIGALLEVKKS